MINVYLVEDESVIRQGIVRSISWEEEGFCLMGNAGDGEMALPEILEKRPDILITDIRMPFMDGLELSRRVKKELPHIKILILSGFNEFDYAKQAIDLGVTEYLLKPVTARQLLDALHKAADAIKEEQATEELVRHLSRRMQRPGDDGDMGVRSRESRLSNTEAMNVGALGAGNMSEGSLQAGEPNTSVSNARALNAAAGDYSDQTPIDVGEVDPKGAGQTALLDFFASGDIDRIDAFIEEYLSALGRNNLKSLFFRQYVISDIYFAGNKYLLGLNMDKDQRERILGPIEEAGKRFAGSMDSGMDYLRQFFTRILNCRDQSGAGRISPQIMKAASFIREHSSEDISLNQAALVADMSPAHFSTVFAREIGEGFSEYLTDRRMEEARQKLAGTSMRITDIAEAVGYRDPHYFSSIFKKTQHMTPKEYRNQVRGEGAEKVKQG
ncbi:MAG: response regulator [Lachnospiraceae bacterium]|nr:response regulator [Lachnospiraceae bacterium]